MAATYSLKRTQQGRKPDAARSREREPDRCHVLAHIFFSRRLPMKALISRSAHFVCAAALAVSLLAAGTPSVRAEGAVSGKNLPPPVFVCPDYMICADGTVVYADGTVVFPDGTVGYLS